MKKILIIVISAFFLLFSFSSVFAIGIGVNPSFLNLDLETNQPKKTKILVYNISQGPGVFQVYPDELVEWIKVEPNNFRLEAGEVKEVKITILTKEKGIKITNLSVLATPLDRQSFGAHSGIKIPLKLNVSGYKPLFLASIIGTIPENWFLLIIIIVLVSFYLVKYFRKKKNKSDERTDFLNTT